MMFQNHPHFISGANIFITSLQITFTSSFHPIQVLKDKHLIFFSSTDDKGIFLVNNKSFRGSFNITMLIDVIKLRFNNGLYCMQGLSCNYIDFYLYIIIDSSTAQSTSWLSQYHLIQFTALITRKQFLLLFLLICGIITLQMSGGLQIACFQLYTILLLVFV